MGLFGSREEKKTEPTPVEAQSTPAEKTTSEEELLNAIVQRFTEGADAYDAQDYGKAGSL